MHYFAAVEKMFSRPVRVKKKTTLDSGLEHDKNYLTFLKPQIQTKRMNNNGNFDMLNIHEIRNSHST